MKCDHASCGTPYCPICGIKIEDLGPIDDLVTYIRKQIMDRERNLKQNQRMVKEGEALKRAGQSTEYRHENAAKNVENHSKALERWQKRFDALVELIQEKKESTNQE